MGAPTAGLRVRPVEKPWSISAIDPSVASPLPHADAIKRYPSSGSSSP
jgi:hypothetical protein